MPLVISSPNAGNKRLSYQIRVIGARRVQFRDVYHAMLRMPWAMLLSLIVIVYLLVNMVFAALYLWVDGIANLPAHTFVDTFFFSVQTMGTIGYGAMYPATRGANVVMVAESIVGMLLTALATGLVFARFSITRARIVFSDKAAIGPMDGVPTLMIRLGNDRNDSIVDAQIRLALMTTTTTKEGMRYYRTADLLLTRSHAPALARSWSVMHRIDASSPLYGETPETLKLKEAEFALSVSGIDELSLQYVNARWTYEHQDIVWGMRLADILTEIDGGDLQIDLSKFHELMPTEPIPGFPFPRAAEPEER